MITSPASRTLPADRPPAPVPITVAGTGALALAAVAGWTSGLVLVGGRVVPGWGVSAVLLVLALGFRRVAGRPRRSALVRWGQRALIGAAVLGTLAGVAGDVLNGARYHVLRPEGRDGCRAVVRETAFLVLGAGEAYAVGRSGWAVGKAGSWHVDDAYRPVEFGTYALTWGADSGLLRVSGTGTDPVLDGGLAELDCGW
ncbi:hypothetical protein [Streptomyces sp. NPDC050145]|uniref:hypothetical protein n=1 Tax=Streptomyces sp. NPDC050145 TaxID=3365602 RepID=UPI0037B8D808